MRRLQRFLLASLMLAAVWVASGAHAADRIYWTNEPANKLSFANLDGSGIGDIPVVGTSVSAPQGIAIDAAAGKVYWINYAGLNGMRISSANLDGTGGADLNTPGATVDSPYGIAIDPAGGRVFWANAPAAPGAISFARIDGSGGGDIDTSGATALKNPLGVAVDPPTGRIYWANYAANRVSYANLDGSGGGADVNTAGATMNGPLGVAVDPAAGRIYWANTIGEKISYANLNGTGGADLNTAGATVDNPAGVAIDPVAGRIYWANDLATISYANLNGSGGGDLPTSGGASDEGSFPALLKAPSAAGAPGIAVAPSKGSALSCSAGSWAPDLLASFLYRAPRSLAYGWSRDGTAVAGADASTLKPSAVGSYRCTVTASNGAGSTSQTSPASAIEVAALRNYAISPSSFRAAPGGPSARASAARKRKKPGAKVSFRLNEGATVVFRVKQRRRGRLVTLAGKLTRAGVRGNNRFRFTGRLRGRKLKPGRYLLAATPTGVGKAGRTRSAGFRIK